MSNRANATGSKTDPLLAKAKSIGDSSSTSVRTYLRRRKKPCATAAGERMENMWEQQLFRHQGQCRRRGRRCSRHWSRDSPAPHGGPHAGAAGCPKEAVTLWGAHAGAGSCQDLWTHGERSPRWSRFAGRACDTVWTHTGAACSWRTAPRGRDPCWGSLWRAAALGRDPSLEQGQSVRSPPTEEERAAETACDELTATPSLRPLPLGGRRERIREWSWAREEGKAREKVF